MYLCLYPEYLLLAGAVCKCLSQLCWLQGRSASATCSSASESQMWDAALASPEARTSRSPRSRSNNTSAQNSPNRPSDMADQLPCSSTATFTGNICTYILFLWPKHSYCFSRVIHCMITELGL